MAAAADPRRSGFDDMSAAIQALQRDDSQNPASLWVAEGEQRFAETCAACHTAAGMRGVAARYPAFDAVLGKPVTLSGRIASCRQRHLHDGASAADGNADNDGQLALLAFVALQSRGLPIAPPADARLAPFRARGEALFRQRIGQLDLSCADCHERNAGRRLGGSTIPQAHPTAYPIYRLEWQGMGSLQRRLRGCMTGVRAQPFADGSDEFTAIELYLAQRAAGMAVESPGVRP